MVTLFYRWFIWLYIIAKAPLSSCYFVYLWNQNDLCIKKKRRIFRFFLLSIHERRQTWKILRKKSRWFRFWCETIALMRWIETACDLFQNIHTHLNVIFSMSKIDGPLINSGWSHHMCEHHFQNTQTPCVCLWF